MAIGMSGQYDFSGCSDCYEDFEDLIWVLDQFDEDDTHDELDSWGYMNAPSVEDIRVTLPCGGKVFFTWNQGLGDISHASC